MRLLTHGYDVDEIVELLESRGIPVHVQRTRQICQVFVCLEKHYDDAVWLLKSPMHRVSEPEDVEQFKALAASQSVWPFLRLVLPLGVILLALAAAAYVASLP